VVEDLVRQYLPPNSYADQWDVEGLYAAALDKLNVDVPIIAWADEDGVDQDVVRERLTAAVDALMTQKEAEFGPETMRNIEKQLLLQIIDTKWRDHLVTLEHLRSAVNFRGLAQRDPLNEYKSEAFVLFDHMLTALREDVTRQLARIRPLSAEEQQAMMAQMQLQEAGATGDGRLEKPIDLPRITPRPDAAAPGGDAPAGTPAPGFDENDPATWGNPGRNVPCPCGSGKKFKHCHGRLA